MAMKKSLRHSRAREERVSKERKEGMLAVTGVCQSKQVPMKSKRIALIVFGGIVSRYFVSHSVCTTAKVNARESESMSVLRESTQIADTEDCGCWSERWTLDWCNEAW